MNFPTMTRIDAHQHFWSLARGDYAWLQTDVPALAPLRRDFSEADLEPLLREHHVTHSVLVQATDTTAETDFLIGLAQQSSRVAGVVGWVDLSRTDAVATLERLAREPKFKGVRPMLQDLPHDDWITTAPRHDAVGALKRLGLRFDALVKPWHLEHLLHFVRQHPELPVVIDHAAKPQLTRGWSHDWAASWRRHMSLLAAQPQVMCKFSGLLTEAPSESCASVAQAAHVVRPVWDHLLQCFGPSRLMWGSDWPVLTLAADYARWVQASSVLIDELPAADRARVWRGNAQRFYGLDAVTPVAGRADPA